MLAAAFLWSAAATGVPASGYRVLAVRVDFPYEDPDHDTTSGRGVFDLRDYYGEDGDLLRDQYVNPWDVPPHDRRFYENHLQALHTYWNTVSEGRVAIAWDVWPRDPESAYTLSKTFYKYGNGRTKEQTYEKLVLLLREALLACKNAEGAAIDFSGYDTFMVIHAGIGSETSGMLNDIPSAYISREDIETWLGGSFSIDGVEIDNGIIVPETTAANGIGGLNGIMAQMFGHRLGLPSLSNNKDGLPAAGGWCLMDTGAMSYGAKTRGFVPTHPCAWSKIELGWIEPVVVTSDITLDIAATHVDNGHPRAVKIPVTADEYLLLENRIRYAPRDSLAHAVYSDTDSSGVWMSVDHYDSYIPGSGILVWRINDAIVREKRAAGEINDDINRRGIDLLEADGREDIGAYIGFGDPRVEYTEGHDDDTYKLSGMDVLSPDTRPDSGSMWGGRSGVTVTVLSDVGDVMRVKITFDSNMKGFPLFLGNKDTITSSDLDGDGIDELIVSGADSAAVIGADGTVLGEFRSVVHPPVTLKDGLLAVPYRNEINYLRLENASLTPVSETIIDFFSGGFRFHAPFAWTEYEGHSLLLHPMRIYDSSHTVTDERLRFEGITGSMMRSAALADTSAIVSLAAHDGTVAVLDAANNLYIEPPAAEDTRMTPIPLPSGTVHGPVMADLDRDDACETILTLDRTLRIFRPDGTRTTAYLDEEPVGGPAVADIDSDGYPEIVIAGPRAVYAYRNDGIPADGFPYTIPPGDKNEIIVHAPNIADIDGDGRPDIMAVTSNMRLLSFTPAGGQTRGFPRALRGRPKQTPVPFVYSPDDSIAVAYIDVDGMLRAHRLGTTAGRGGLVWIGENGGASLASSLSNDDIPSDVRTTAVFEAYCYPNPITGGAGTFRFVADTETDCTIALFTADGSKVFEHHVPRSEVTPGVPNEVRLNASKLASGLYIAKFTTRTKTVFYKVGVLK